MTLVVLLVVAAILFALAFFTKRRYGVLGLGLAAGIVLSREVSKDMTDFLQYGDFPVQPLTHSSAAGVILIIAPALLLMFSGPKYNDKRAAIVGSAAFAMFGTVLLLVPLSLSLATTDRSVQPILSTVAANSPTIIAAGVIIAVVDMMQTHGKKPFSKKDKH